MNQRYKGLTLAVVGACFWRSAFAFFRRPAYDLCLLEILGPSQGNAT